MMPLAKLLHIGDPSLTLAAAAAMAAWLLAGRAWRMAFWWSLLFGLGIGTVGASKVAFMAWGMALPGLEFKAISGHASGVTAVLPTLFYLLLRPLGERAQRIGMVAGLALGALMGTLLVLEGEHSVAEAVAGWAMGALISLGSIRMAGKLPPRRPVDLGLACAALVFVGAAWLMRPVPFGYLLMRTAVLLSGNCALFSLNSGS